jgi:hypothetical protein
VREFAWKLTAEKQDGQIRNQLCRWNPDAFRQALAGFSNKPHSCGFTEALLAQPFYGW